MVLGMNSFNMFNTTGTFGMSNMFGMGGSFGGCGLLGSGFGGSIFGGGFGTSPFTDCNGYTNYDAMAGFAIGNQLMNIAGMGINYAISNAGGTRNTANSVANNLQDRLAELEEERDTIISTSGTTAEAILNYNKESSDEYIAWDQAQKTYNAKAREVENGAVLYEANKTALADVVRELVTATGDEKTQLETQKTNLEIKIKNHEDLVDERAQLETDLKTKRTALDENDAKMVKAQEDLRAVDEELREVRSEINEAILDMADGSKVRHRNTNLTVDNIEEGCTTATREDIAQLIYLFRNTDESSEANKGLKREYATALTNIENSAFLNAASNDQVKARKIMQDWLTANTPQKQG